MVSAGGRPAEYIANNGSNSMWAPFFPESIPPSFWSIFWHHFWLHFGDILASRRCFLRILRTRKKRQNSGLRRRGPWQALYETPPPWDGEGERILAASGSLLEERRPFLEASWQCRMKASLAGVYGPEPSTRSFDPRA